MSIEASCLKCGASYRVKDEHAGKKFRCKKCQAAISVPLPEADPWDTDPWEDGSFDDGGEEETYQEAPRPRRVTPGPSRTKQKSKKRRSRDGDTMPVPVWIAIGCIGILMLLNVIGIVAQAMDQNIAGASGSFLRLMVEIGVVIGLVKRSSVSRWTAIILSGIMTVLFGCCGAGILAMSETVAQEGNIPPGFVMFIALIVLGQILIEVPIIVCLLLPAAEEWCNE